MEKIRTEFNYHIENSGDKLKESGAIADCPRDFPCRSDFPFRKGCCLFLHPEAGPGLNRRVSKGLEKNF